MRRARRILALNKLNIDGKRLNHAFLKSNTHGHPGPCAFRYETRAYLCYHLPGKSPAFFMDQILGILWLVLGVALIVAEVFTLGFVLLWFGIGAIVAALVGLMGFGFAWQFAAFAIVSVALTAMSRTIFSTYLHHSEAESLKSGSDSMPGQIGTVTIASKGALNEGAVKVFGSTWTAFPEDDETVLREGEKVEVVRIQGSSIYVRPVSKELPGWRDKEEN
jgi:inner membrane protein